MFWRYGDFMSEINFEIRSDLIVERNKFITPRSFVENL